MLNESEKNQVKNMIAKGKGEKEAADTLMLFGRETQEYPQELITEGLRPRDENILFGFVLSGSRAEGKTPLFVFLC